MHQNKFKLTCAVLLAVMLVLSGCLGGASKTPATRFYVLNSLYSAENKARPTPVAVLEDAAIGVGPIKAVSGAGPAPDHPAHQSQ